MQLLHCRTLVSFTRWGKLAGLRTVREEDTGVLAKLRCFRRPFRDRAFAAFFDFVGHCTSSYFTCRYLSKSRDNFFVISLQQRSCASKELPGSLRSELYELKFIGNLPKTILHSNACHKISPLRRQEKLVRLLLAKRVRKARNTLIDANRDLPRFRGIRFGSMYFKYAIAVSST